MKENILENNTESNNRVIIPSSLETANGTLENFSIN